jgi:hypothetical protein
MLKTEIATVLDVAEACLRCGRPDLIRTVLLETCHEGKAVGLEYLRVRRAGEQATGARQMRTATPTVTNDAFRDAIEKRFHAQNGRAG